MRERVGKTGQINLGVNAQQLFNASPFAATYKITNLSAIDVYLGFDATVTASTGDLLVGIKGSFVIVETNSPIWAIGNGARLSYIQVPCV